MIYETRDFSKKKALEHKSQNSGVSRQLAEGFWPNTSPGGVDKSQNSGVSRRLAECFWRTSSPGGCITHACLGTLQMSNQSN